MHDLQWTPDLESWTMMLNNDVFDELEIEVKTDGEADSPTPKQIAAVDMICSLTRADLKTIPTLVKTWAEENMEEEDLEEMEAEDFELEIGGVVVPKLRDSEALYFIFTGDSEVDIEHGLGCVCKNGSQFAICDTDYAYMDYDWDAIKELETLFA